MWKEALLLIVVIGYVTVVPGQVNEDDKAIDDAAGGSGNPVDVRTFVTLSNTVDSRYLDFGYLE